MPQAATVQASLMQLLRSCVCNALNIANSVITLQSDVECCIYCLYLQFAYLKYTAYHSRYKITYSLPLDHLSGSGEPTVVMGS